MPLIDLDFVQFYEGPANADLAGKRPSMALPDDIPVIRREGYTSTAPRSSSGWGGQLGNYDLIEVLECTGSLSKDPLDLLSCKQAPDLKGTELYSEGNVCRLWFWWAFNNSSSCLKRTRS